VYQLLGGKAREAAATYATVGGMEVPEIIDHAREAMKEGFRCIKLQTGVPGMAAYGPRGGPEVKGLHAGPVFEPGPYMRRTRQMLEECRKQLGEEIGLIHDVHERVSPHQAVQFAKKLEHLELASSNFGIHEGGVIRGVEAEIFTGCATYKDGYLWASDSPGWGIEVNEQLAAKYPFRDGPDHLNGGWGEIRLKDGSIINQ
jgi:L-alanine-DL-glutamate epimerase-like enolase superfamily enzyme